MTGMNSTSTASQTIDGEVQPSSRSPAIAPTAPRTGGSTNLGISLGSLFERLDPAWPQSSDAEAATARVGLDRFEVIRRLGVGGFGEVWLVRDRVLACDRAMKIPRSGQSSGNSLRARFLREARAVAGLNHPNVVRVLEAQEVGPTCVMIMEFCEGGSLAAWLARRPASSRLPARWVAEFMAKLADGVGHVHARGLLHRDIKPGNVLLDFEGDPTADLPRLTPKVADFGLVKNVDEADADGLEPTASNALVGTLAYMAPEQARRNPSGISAATDVYGLGTILYEMLTGCRPFAELGQVKLIDHILHHEPGALGDQVPIELETICRRCLAKSPLDRYVSGEELALDLRRWLQDEPIQGRREPLRKRTWRGVRRHRSRISLIGIGLFALALAGGQWELKGRQDARAWLERLGVANILGLPKLLAERDAADSRVADQVAAMFASGTSDQRLVAAIHLAPSRADCASHAVDQLLKASPDLVRPLAEALGPRLTDLVPWLERTLIEPPPIGASPEDLEAHDLRRARAATALIILGHEAHAWPLLEFATRPQSRSLLIRDLGPSGVEPARVVDQLRLEPDESTRRGLIQALGQIPEDRWTTSLRDSTTKLILKMYRDDRDRGVHGSAKWFLRFWKRDDLIDQADVELVKRPETDPPAQWRVSESGLTFITVPVPGRERLIEVLDTEVTGSLFLKFRPNHSVETGLAGKGSCPVMSMTYCDAVEFCDWLNGQEHLPPSYRRIDPPGSARRSVVPVAGYLDQPGYRLLTLEEFMNATQAGTTTYRYFGDSDALAAAYVWSGSSSQNRVQPVALLKPNDYGLFDLLGNVFEIGQSTSLPNGPQNPAIVFGGSMRDPTCKIRWDYYLDGLQAHQKSLNQIYGFRIARTVRSRYRPSLPAFTGIR